MRRRSSYHRCRRRTSADPPRAARRLPRPLLPVPGRWRRASSPAVRRWRRPWPSPTERDRRAERSHRRARSPDSMNGYRKSVRSLIERHRRRHRRHRGARSRYRRGSTAGRRARTAGTIVVSTGLDPARRADGRASRRRRSAPRPNGLRRNTSRTRPRPDRTPPSVAASRPACSRQTCASSHSTWYWKTSLPSCAADATSSSTHRTWSAAPLSGRSPAPIQIDIAPHATARRTTSRTTRSVAAPIAITTSPGATSVRSELRRGLGPRR